MSDYWENKWIGIAQPINADVHIMAIQFNISIDGCSWKRMTTDEKIAKYREKLGLALVGLDQAIEDEVIKYQNYKFEMLKEEK